MDWFGVDMPVAYYDIDPGAASAGVAWPEQWLVLVPVTMAVAIFAGSLLSRRRRRTFWCSLAEREVVVEYRRGSVRSCTAFENPKAVACGRPCRDGAFRRRWPPALPVLAPGRRVA